MTSITHFMSLRRIAHGRNPGTVPLWFLAIAGLALLGACGDFTLFPEDKVYPEVVLTVEPAETKACGQENVTVDGSGSTDPEPQEEEVLLYEWTFALKPDGSEAAFVDSTAATTTFSPDEPGTYEVMLKVTTSIREASAEKTATMTAKDTPVAAFTYSPESVTAGDKVSLDGGGSKNPTENCSSEGLTFLWELSAPPESSAVLDDPSSETPSFTADKAGDYQLLLTVTQEDTPQETDTKTESFTAEERS